MGLRVTELRGSIKVGGIHRYSPETVFYSPFIESTYPFTLPEYRNMLVIHSNAIDIHLI